MSKRGMSFSFYNRINNTNSLTYKNDQKWKIKTRVQVTYHIGVLFRPSVISDNRQGVEVALFSVQQTRHCDAALKQPRF